MKAVILAGGLGKRLLPITEHIPKALVKIEGIPIIHKQLLQLEENGFKEVIILTGHLSHQIEQYLEKYTFRFDLKILCSPVELSPAERIIKFREEIGENFTLLYCDNFLPDSREVFHLNSPFKYKFILNSRKEGNIRIQDKNKLEITTSKRSRSFPFVEIGYTTINDTDFFPTLISTKDLNECFKIITQTQDVQYLEYSGQYFSLSNIGVYQNVIDKSKILFLDRDGIINKSVGHRKYVTKFEEFDFVEENLVYLQKLSSLGFMLIILTNQPGVSTGEVNKDFLIQLHEYLFMQFLERKINLLAIYVCQHHWDEKCSCRKPKPGLIQAAIEDFGLHNQSLLFIGDHEKDNEAAEAIGIEGMVVNENLGNKGNFGLISNARLKIEKVYGVMLN